jgi:hypothetical protein
MRCLTPPIDQILIRKYVASKDLRRANKLFGVVSMLLLDYVVISMMYGVHMKNGLHWWCKRQVKEP